MRRLSLKKLEAKGAVNRGQWTEKAPFIHLPSAKDLGRPTFGFLGTDGEAFVRGVAGGEGEMPKQPRRSFFNC